MLIAVATTLPHVSASKIISLLPSLPPSLPLSSPSLSPREGGRGVLSLPLFLIAIDIDPVEIACARRNAELYGVAYHIEFLVGDYFTLVPHLKVSIIVATTSENQLLFVRLFTIAIVLGLFTQLQVGCFLVGVGTFNDSFWNDPPVFKRKLSCYL